MIDRLIRGSIRHAGLTALAALVAGGGALWYAQGLAIDAVPDITTNQVQINTLAAGYAPEEMEQYVTFPLEVALASLPAKEEIRSISQPGLSQVTVTFADGEDPYRARQLVLERLREAEREFPAGVEAELAPISTGLGEIFQFTVEDPAGRLGPMERRTLLDWQVKPRLRTVPGVIEVNAYGGQVRQFEVRLDPAQLVRHGVRLDQVLEAISRNNANAGGAYLEAGGEQQLIRGVGLLGSAGDIEKIVVRARQGVPLVVGDLGTVGTGHAIRQGAATKDGRGEAVIGVAMLLRGENSRTVAAAVLTRLAEIEKTLPGGVKLAPFYDRTDLVDRTIATAGRNLAEGGLLVAGVLLLFLLQWRAGLIVASVIPLAMAAAAAGMRHFGVSANLMSLGAIDFGLIVDAAVIMVEHSVRELGARRRELGRALDAGERRAVIEQASLAVRRASQFGEMIIIAAYLPILTLAGVEGKMFRPMAFTVILALSAALLLSLTAIPALSALFLRDREEKEHRVLAALEREYAGLLTAVLAHPGRTAGLAAVFVGLGAAGFGLLGGEFLPELDEGAIAMSQARPKSISLAESVGQASAVERELMTLPEVASVVSRIGRPEIATDPMGPDLTDTYIFLRPEAQWRGPEFRAALLGRISERMARFPGLAVGFSQPIKFRMMELIEGIGSRSDVALRIYGEDPLVLRRLAEEAARRIGGLRGAADVKVQQLDGLPTASFAIDRAALARQGVDAAEVQRVLTTAVAGTRASVVFDGFRRVDLMVRFGGVPLATAADLALLPVATPAGPYVPLGQLAPPRVTEGPAEISRENGERRIAVEMNVRGRDVGSFVAEAQAAVGGVRLPPGYRAEWGGSFEHLESGRRRLALAVPATFALILLLLFLTFGAMRPALLVFSGIPCALTGGVFALLAREMPFSISAGVGFIAVSGVAVLNGVVMLSFIEDLRRRGQAAATAIAAGALGRLRPVLMTATVASLGFLPMAVSTGTGAEVQRPVATVVIGGLVSSTLLTLVVLPALAALWGPKENHG